MPQFSSINYRKLGTFDSSLSLRSPSDPAVSATTSTTPIEFDARTFNAFSVALVHSDITNVTANTSEWTVAVQVASSRSGTYTTVANQKLSSTGYRYQISLSGDEVAAAVSSPRWVRLTATKTGTPGDLTFWGWITEAVGIGVPPSALGAVPTPSPTPSPSPSPTPTPTPSTPTPTVAIANTTPKAGLINEAITVVATATILGDTLASVQFRADGANIGLADTSSPYSASYAPTSKGVKQLSAVATGTQGGTATSANYSFQAFDSKVTGGGTGAGGASLGADPADYVLFDTNLAGGNASTMAIFVGGQQVGAFNYDDSSYAGKPFAYFYGATSTLYTNETIKPTVNF